MRHHTMILCSLWLLVAAPCALAEPGPGSSVPFSGSPFPAKPVSPPVTAAQATADWTGTWSTTYGTMTLKQEGGSVTGTYTWDGGGSKIKGSASGGTLTGVWDERPPPCDTGPISFTMNETGTAFAGTWEPGCQSRGGKWKGTRTLSSGLKLSLKSKPAKNDGFTTLRVTARNSGQTTLESVRIQDNPTLSVRKRGKGCRGELVEKVASPAALGTLAPGEAKESDFVFKHLCAGTVRVKVDGEGMSGSTPVRASAEKDVTIRTTAWIVGEIKPVALWPGVFSPEVGRYVKRITSPVVIRADGKYTGRAKISEGPNGPVAHYSIKVEGGDVGRTRLEPLAPRGWKMKPRAEAVNLKPGERRTVNFGVAYDCDAAAPGLDFSPNEGFYNASGTPLAVSYRCVSRAVRVGMLLTSQPNYDAERGILGCQRADGEPYPARITDHVAWSFPTLLESKGRFSTRRFALGESEIVTFAGEYSRVDVGGATIRHKECGVDRTHRKLEFGSSTVYNGP